MKRYRIFDLHKGLLSEDEIVYADSPKKAVEKAYPTKDVYRHTFEYAKRTGIWNADVVVNGKYCYVVVER